MNNTVKIVIIVVALAGAIGLVAMNLGKEKPGDMEGPNKSFYVCSDPKCATEFEVEPGKSIAPPSSRTEICPTCKKDYPLAAAKCNACGKMHVMKGHGIAEKNCPFCDAPIPPLAERLKSN